MQYFIGYRSFSDAAPFDPSLDLICALSVLCLYVRHARCKNNFIMTNW